MRFSILTNRIFDYIIDTLMDKDCNKDNKYYVFNELMKTGLINKDNFEFALVIAQNAKTAEDLVFYMLIREDGNYSQIPQAFRNDKQFMLRACAQSAKLYNELYAENNLLFKAVIRSMGNISTIDYSKVVQPAVKAEATAIFNEKCSKIIKGED